MTDPVIRPATASDAELLTGLAAKSFYDTYAWYNTEEDMDNYLASEFTLEKFQDALANRLTRFFIVIIEGKPAGYAQVKEIAYEKLQEIPSLEIVRLYAEANMIGKGIGKLLMEACIKYAISRKITLIWLIVWQENTRAISFYTKWGFEIFDTHLFQLGKDIQNDWVMKKELKQA